jgi:fructose-bisphosphate aldolase class II
MAVGALQMMRRMAKENHLRAVPVALHLDHGADFAIAKSCIETGFSSVMIDGSALSYEENVKVTKAVVKYAHKYGVTVEAELGVLAGQEDEVQSEMSHYTDPKQAADFIARTGADSLAVSVGTSHGAYKFKPGQVPGIRLDIIKAIGKLVGNIPLVLHGASSVLPQYVEMINNYGGKMIAAAGIPEGDIRKATKLSVCKVNIDSDGRLVMTAEIRRHLAENPAEFDPRKYLSPARTELQKMYTEKIKNVLGSAKKA